MDATEFVKRSKAMEAADSNLRLGVVSSVGGEMGIGPEMPTIKVTIAGDDEPVSVRYLGSYKPEVGDTVVLYVQNSDIIVLGSTKKSSTRDFEEDPLKSNELGQNVVDVDNIIDGAVARVKIAEAAINEALIDEDAVTTEKIASNTIIGDHIQARQVDAFHVVAGSITANEIASRTITADRIKANEITANEIAANTITANQIAANTISADQISSGSLTSASGVFGTISADDITTGTLNANDVTVTNLSADSITGGTINGNTVSVTNLNASNITGGTLNANNVNISNLQADSITGGTLSGVIVEGGPVTLSSNGITIGAGVGVSQRIRWSSSGITRADIYTTTQGALLLAPSGDLFCNGRDIVLDGSRYGLINANSGVTIRHSSTTCAETGTGTLGQGLWIVPGDIINSGMRTTVSSANVVHFDSSGRLARSTSLSAYKSDVESVEAEYADKVLELRPIFYRSLAELDRKDWSYYGLIAEEVAEVDPRIALYDPEDGSLTGVSYDKIGVLLIDVVRRLRDRVEQLERAQSGR